MGKLQVEKHVADEAHASRRPRCTHAEDCEALAAVVPGVHHSTVPRKVFATVAPMGNKICGVQAATLGTAIVQKNACPVLETVE